MSYTPQNLTSYTAAYAGAFSGLVAGGRQPQDAVESDYQQEALIAGAFAREWDTLWGSGAPDTLEVFAIFLACYGAFEGRNAALSTEALSPAAYTVIATGIIAAVADADTYVRSQGIVPDAWPSGGGGGGNEIVAQVPFTFNESSPVIVGAVAAGSLMDRVDILITTPFTDPSATLAFGLVSGPPDAFFQTTDSAPSVAGQYERQSLEQIEAPGMLQLTIAPGTSSAGAGILFYKLLGP
jgi:hypothetical protein